MQCTASSLYLRITSIHQMSVEFVGTGGLQAERSINTAVHPACVSEGHQLAKCVLPPRQTLNIKQQQADM
jgi:hypothetical protein